MRNQLFVRRLNPLRNGTGNLIHFISEFWIGTGNFADNRSGRRDEVLIPRRRLSLAAGRPRDELYNRQDAVRVDMLS